jgi:integrase
MSRRRGNNEGTIFQDKDGVWWAQLPPDDQGRRPKRRAKTQREARDKLRELERERAQGMNLTAKQPTVEEFATTWLEQVVRRSVKASTHDSYRYIITRYVIPAIGNLRLDKLTTPRVQKLVNDLTDQEYSPSTVRNAYIRLSAMLDVAVSYRLITHNVANGVVLPKIGTGPQRALTVDEARALLAALGQIRNVTAFYLLLGLGLRRGEVLGLRWADLDWEARTIRVTQQVQLVAKKVIISTPKTEGSGRLLPLTSRMLARLQQKREAQETERRAQGAAWQDNGLIFATENGTPTSPRNLNRTFDVARARAKLTDVRLHDLRHTFATLLGELGVAEGVIGALLGHVPANITQHYARATLPAMREAVELLEKQYAGAAPGTA